MTDRHELRVLGAELHQRLLDGDPTAPARIAEALLGSLIASVERRYPNLPDPHLVSTAVDDALIGYFNRPDRYDPAKLDLFGYLRMSAKGDLLNALRRTGVSSDSIESDVELEDDDAEQKVEIADGPSVEDQVLANLSPIWPRLAALFPEQVDREIVWLLMEGERDTDEYAALLGILDLPREERFREVKRHKDRVKVMIRRHVAEFKLDE